MNALQDAVLAKFSPRARGWTAGGRLPLDLPGRFPRVRGDGPIFDSYLGVDNLRSPRVRGDGPVFRVVEREYEHRFPRVRGDGPDLGGHRWESITPHNPEQNGLVERVIRTLKEESVRRRRFETLQHANRVIGDSIGFNNHRRPHQARGMKTPAEAYALAA